MLNQNKQVVDIENICIIFVCVRQQWKKKHWEMKSVGLNIKRAFCRSKQNEKKKLLNHKTFIIWLSLSFLFGKKTFLFNCFTLVSYDGAHSERSSLKRRKGFCDCLNDSQDKDWWFKQLQKRFLHGAKQIKCSRKKRRKKKQ